MPSTTIRRFGYDPDRQILSVWFVPSGHRYDYEAVPPALVAAFRQAGSKGRFFNAHIRDRFAYRRIA
jgi:KTSC domain